MSEQTKVEVNKALLELYNNLHTRRKQRQNDGDRMGYMKGTRLANMFEDAYEAAGNELDGDFQAHIQPGWQSNVEAYMAETWTKEPAEADDY